MTGELALFSLAQNSLFELRVARAGIFLAVPQTDTIELFAVAHRQYRIEGG